jgi:hypothetical protein
MEVWKIEEEERVLAVKAETRSFGVEEEIRVGEVPAETRKLEVLLP